jgi:crotonobetainyl-CoA:carnitine CoA-transferase CaiB-like acyl-CoA transferase
MTTQPSAAMLGGIKVLDVTQVVAGSFGSMQLADLGADVVKVERVGRGDIGRGFDPTVGATSAYFASVNRNKKSIALDLKSDEGSQAFLDLAEHADVVVENYRPGTMDSFGLGYEDVREVNPEIVYCSISGFGQTGPYAEYPALDIIIQAFSGVMSITGPEDGQPYRAGPPIADVSGSMYAAQSVLAALFERERTGEGTHIDVSMAESMISWLTVRAGWSFGTGEPYPRKGNELDEFVPYGVYECADGYLAICAVQDHHWDRLADAIGRPELGDDDRFETADDRRANRDQVNAILDDALADEQVRDLFDDLAAQNIPAAPVHDTLEIWEDEHVSARDLHTTVETPEGEIDAIRHPVSFEGTSNELPRGVAALGEHTREELAAAGYSQAEIDEVLESGAAGEP